jgi:predicted SAM-dependent methyltransferase
MHHRDAAYALLAGRGLEIGALHEPARLPDSCRVEYFDVISRESATALFPEVPAERLVAVDHVGDLDMDGLASFGDEAFDFVIINHVLEHLANPVKSLREVFRITRRGGIVVLAVPDKEYTYDRARAPTPFEHLWTDYTNDTRVNSDEHYLDFLRSAGPHVFLGPPERIPGDIQFSRQRREHAHVWTSASFRAFLAECFARLSIRTQLRYESFPPENTYEYFAAWQREA